MEHPEDPAVLDALRSPGRLAALQELDVFPGVVDAAFACYVRLVASLLHVPVALVSMVTDDRQFFPASVGLDEPWRQLGETPLTLSFCKHVVADDSALVVTDAALDERFRSHPAVDELRVRAYLGVPLRSPQGLPLGSLCAIDEVPHAWTAQDVATLHDLAEAASAMIALRGQEHRQRVAAQEASHQLRTPVAALRFEVDALARLPRAADPEVQASLDAMGDRLAALAAIADEIVARSQRDHWGGVTADAVEILHSTATRWRPALASGGRDITVRGAGPIPVDTVQPALQRAVDLLVEGAVRRGVGSVALSAEAGPGACRIRVESDALERVDLAEVRELVAGIGGRVLRPEGTVVELVLPRPTEASDLAPQA